MQAAVPAGQGAMAAILGLDFDAVAGIAADAAGEDICAAANDNDPAQVVISGHAAAVARAVEIAKDRGAKRAILLPVSAPFHCALMAPAADVMADALAGVTLSVPRVPLVGNVTATAETAPDAIVAQLVAQVTGRVRWRESIGWMVAQGVTETWEIGAGKALSGMVKRIDRAVETRSAGTADEVRALAEMMGRG
jgi:[acyl-carrier-protein] S-malonyltransferase